MSGFGLAVIVIESSIFEIPRNWMIQNKRWFLYLPSMLFCFLCVGFWIGVVSSVYLYSPASEAFPGVMYPEWTYLLLDALTMSIMVWLLHVIETKIGG